MLTEGYEHPRNAFQLFGISRLSRMQCTWGIFEFGSN